MNSNEKMQSLKVRWLLRHHTPNKYRFPEKYAHPLLFLSFFFSFPFRWEKELLGGRLSTHQERLAGPRVLNIINNNQQKFEFYAAMLTGHMKISIQNFLTNKTFMVKLEMIKQVNQYIVRTRSRLSRVPKFMSQIWHQGISCQK